MSSPLSTTDSAAQAVLSAATHPDCLHTDDALALGFVRANSNLRYTATWNRWHEWDGTHWREDRTIAVFDHARRYLRSIARTAPEFAVRLSSGGTVSAIEKLARSDRACASVPEQWDADDWALSTPGGMVDLRIGRIRPARKEDYATKSTAVAPEGTCPLWLEFLDHVTGHDVEMQLFLQRMLGYCLTGSVRDHALFFLYGSGGNGKSTFLETARSILGEYARTAPTGMLMASNSDRHPTEIAGLRSIRMAITTEVEEGRVWDIAKLKSLTGGDAITARRMRENFFDFDPKFKLLIAGNDRPTIRKVDEAIRRRFHVVPFCAKIERPDPDFRQKLVKEWPGILAWMIEGCLMWQEHGLSAPRAITNATDDYLREQDVVGRWVTEECELKPNVETPIAELFEAWETWCGKSDEKCISKRAFGDALAQRAEIERRRSGHEKTRVLVGIRLKR